MLKFFLTTAAAFMVAVAAFGQKIVPSDLPAGVLESFKDKYGAARSAVWVKGESNTYEADFEMDSTAFTATFNERGEWIQTESTIDADDLPPTVRNTIAKQYAGYLVAEAMLIDTDDVGRLYEVDIERDDDSIRLWIDEDGKIISREKDSNDG